MPGGFSIIPARNCCHVEGTVAQWTQFSYFMCFGKSAKRKFYCELKHTIYSKLNGEKGDEIQSLKWIWLCKHVIAPDGLSQYQIRKWKKEEQYSKHTQWCGTGFLLNKRKTEAILRVPLSNCVKWPYKFVRVFRHQRHFIHSKIDEKIDCCRQRQLVRKRTKFCIRTVSLFARKSCGWVGKKLSHLSMEFSILYWIWLYVMQSLAISVRFC